MIWEELCSNQTVAAGGGQLVRLFSSGVARTISMRLTQAVALVEASLAVNIQCNGKNVFNGTLRDLITITKLDGGVSVSTLQCDIRLPIGAWDAQNGQLVVTLTNNDVGNAFSAYVAVGYENGYSGKRVAYTTLTMAAGGVVNMPNVTGIMSHMANTNTTTDDLTLTVGQQTISFPMWIGYETYNKQIPTQDTSRGQVFGSGAPVSINVVHVGAGTPIMLFVQEV